MSDADATAAETQPYSGRTAWARSLERPLVDFMRTETGSAAFLLAATVAALVWVNADRSSYESLWHTQLQIRVGSGTVGLDLRHWLNSGLMTFFFFVVGLEARREFDIGELRERRRVTLPLVAGLGGMAVPVLIYLALNAGHGTTHGWGAAMSTDTAFALGMLALVGPRFPSRLRSFMLTVVVVDDVVALIVIATVYTGHVWMRALVAAGLVFVLVLAVRAAGLRVGPLYVGLGTALWVALLKSGVDPVLAGLAMGLLAYAYPASRSDLERASDLFRLFREQPTPELARSARVGLQSAVSPNERLLQVFHPWTSYVIVPLFALANAGIPLSSSFLGHAFTSPITLGILIGYVVGKPVGVVGSALIVTRVTRGRLRPPVGWAAVAGGGAIAGIGFTVSILIATLAFHGGRLEEAKLGVLSAALVSSAATWTVFRATERLPKQWRLRLLIGSARPIVDLAVAVDPDRDHIRGSLDAPVTLVEYGDLECPFCGQAEPVIRELLADFGDLRYVWRHLPLNDVHPMAQQAAEATEAAAQQGAFWELHDLLLGRQSALRLPDLIAYAEELGLDTEQFSEDMRKHSGRARIAEDVDGADLSGVSGTPSFFVNGRRHYGAYDIATLTTAVRAARARAALKPHA
ncbi:MAG TPA: Na+/H+ antiporter NhaA, partial [Gaiellales bacterium]